MRAIQFGQVRLFVTQWTISHQAPLSMGFSRQEYWSGLPCPPPGDLPDPGIEPTSLTSPALTGGFFTTSTIWELEAQIQVCLLLKPRYCLSDGGEQPSPGPQGTTDRNRLTTLAFK